MIRTAILAALLSSLLVACQTVDDPRQGGLFNGIANLATGGYEQRITARQTELQGQESTQTRLQGQAVALQQEHARLQQELTAARVRLDGLEASIRAQQARLERERRLQAADRTKLRQQQARLQQAEANAHTIRTQLQRAGQANQPAGDSRHQLQEMQQRLDGLNDLVKTLAGG